jgi:hypothetical protein
MIVAEFVPTHPKNRFSLFNVDRQLMVEIVFVR